MTIAWQTVAVVVAVCTAVVVLAFLKADVAYVAAIGGIGTAVAALLRPVVSPTTEKDRPTTPVSMPSPFGPPKP